MDHDLKGSSPESLNASIHGVALDHTRTKLAGCVGTDLPLLETNGVSAYENLSHIKYALAHTPPDSGNGTCATRLEAKLRITEIAIGDIFFDARVCLIFSHMKCFIPCWSIRDDEITNEARSEELGDILHDRHCR